jgi:hypothetical protein
MEGGAHRGRVLRTSRDYDRWRKSGRILPGRDIGACTLRGSDAYGYVARCGAG